MYILVLVILFFWYRKISKDEKNYNKDRYDNEEDAWNGFEENLKKRFKK